MVEIEIQITKSLLEDIERNIKGDTINEKLLACIEAGTTKAKIYISQKIYNQLKSLAESNKISINILASRLLAKMIYNHRHETRELIEKLKVK